MRKIIKWTLPYCLAFALGWYCMPKRIVERVVTIHTPPQMILTVANQGVEISPRLRLMNLEADVPIFMVSDEEALRQLVDYKGDGFIQGAYCREPEAIYLLGTWSLDAETVIHEYTHMLEAEIPDQAWRIRKVFHRLCSDKFRIDSQDLEPVLPDPQLNGPAFQVVQPQSLIDSLEQNPQP